MNTHYHIYGKIKNNSASIPAKWSHSKCNDESRLSVVDYNRNETFLFRGNTGNTTPLHNNSTWWIVLDKNFWHRDLPKRFSRQTFTRLASIFTSGERKSENWILHYIFCDLRGICTIERKWLWSVWSKKFIFKNAEWYWSMSVVLVRCTCSAAPSNGGIQLPDIKILRRQLSSQRKHNYRYPVLFRNRNANIKFNIWMKIDSFFIIQTNMVKQQR